MSAPTVTTVVITDTNVLINFLHIGQLALLGELPAYRLQLPADHCSASRWLQSRTRRKPLQHAVRELRGAPLGAGCKLGCACADDRRSQNDASLIRVARATFVA